MCSMKRISSVPFVIILLVLLLDCQLIQSQLTPFRFRIVTWNVGNSEPDCNTFERLAFSSSTDSPRADLIVFGFQEATKKVFGSSAFHTIISACLQNKQYVKILSDYVGSDLIKPIWLYIYVPNVAPQSRRVSLLNIKGEPTLTVHPDKFLESVVGYKGVIAAHVRIDNTTDVIFANMHLPAGDGNVEARCRLWSKFLRAYQDDQTNHDYMFAFGDQNWRTTNTMSIDKILEAVQNKDYRSILDKDELTQMRHNDSAVTTTPCLNTFYEASITFPPTYKYVVNTDTYQTQKGREDRRPSYTDRILVSDLSQDLRIVQYSAMNEIKLSDHRPVFGDFLLHRPVDSKYFIKEPKKSDSVSSTANTQQVSKRNPSKSTMVIVLVIIIAILICLSCLIVLYRFVIKRRANTVEVPQESWIELAPVSESTHTKV